MDVKKETFKQINAYAAQLGPAVHLTDEQVAGHWETHILNRPPELDTFFTILDYRVPGFTYTHGIPEVLGVKEELNIGTYLDRVHPAMLQLYGLWGMEALELAMKHTDQLEPFKFTYRVAFPILHGNGQYYSIIQNSTILQLDASKQMISQLNTYRMGIAFNEVDIQNLRGEIFSASVSSQKWNEVFVHNISQKILGTFTRKENEILQTYAAGLFRPEEMAKKYNITVPTLYTHHRNILKKAHTLFFRGFGNVIEVADYLKNSGFLPK